LIQLRREHRGLRRRKFFMGRRIRGAGIRDIMWFRPDGEEMSDEEWEAGWVRSLGVLLAGEALDDVDQHGNPLLDDTLFILLNAHHEPLEFVLPPTNRDCDWDLEIDTARPAIERRAVSVKCGATYAIGGRAVALFRQDREAILR
jgi:glycogen operon protein